MNPLLSLKRCSPRRLSIHAALLAFFIFAKGEGKAATYTFNGATDSAWETTSNWNGGILPTSSDDTNYSANAILTTAQTIRRIISTNGKSLTINSGGNFTMAGSVPLLNNGTIIINSGGILNTTRPLDLRSGGGSVFVNDGGTLSIVGTGLAALRMTNGSLTINGSSADVTIDRLITAPENSWVYEANNSTITLNSGTLKVSQHMIWDGASALSVGSGSALILSNSTESNTLYDGLLIEGGDVTVAGSLSLEGAALSINGSGSFNLGMGSTTGSLANNSTITVASGGSFTVNRSNTVTQGTDFSGSAITGAGGFGQVGSGTTVLNAANTYTGATTISAGTLTLSGGSAIADTAEVSIASGAVLNLGASETIGSIAGAGNVALGSYTLTAGGDNSSTTLSGVISGSGGLTKSGAGMLTLTSNNTYTGATTISGGELLIQGNAAVVTGYRTATTVGNGATLSFKGGLKKIRV